MRNVEEFKGNTTDNLWGMMGDVTNAQGVERHGQSCFLYVYPNGTAETRQMLSSEIPDSPVLSDEGDAANGPIDAVITLVRQNYIEFNGGGVQEDDLDNVADYDGYRVGAGWIFGALFVAKTHGCTQASIGMSSNDGNLYMQAWDRELGAFVTAVHVTYYGT